MKSIKELWEDFMESQRKSKHRRIEMRANELFQVVERDGQLWFGLYDLKAHKWAERYAGFSNYVKED